MKTTCRKIVAGSLLLFALVIAHSPLAGAQGRNVLQQAVSGIDIYLGIVPAEFIRGYPHQHPERTMHGGSDAGGYHVVVALFEHATGRRITDAEVNVRLGEPSRPGPGKRLEPMTIADSQTYGNYLDMARGGSYRIDVQIRRPGLTDPIHATFHWSTP